MSKTKSIAQRSQQGAERRFYHYHQNNTGGRFQYNPDRGISVDVYIEANSVKEANERAKRIGIYFDGYGDCSCCGNRWYSIDEYTNSNYYVTTTPPTEDEVLLRDDNDELSPVVTKWLKDGEAESFVHLADGSFYGAHQNLTHILRDITGYGFIFSQDYIGDIIGVGNDGWDQSGNMYFPAPNSETSLFRSDRIEHDSDNLRVQNSGFGAYRVWCRHEQDALQLQRLILERLTGSDSQTTEEVVGSLSKGDGTPELKP